MATLWLESTAKLNCANPKGFRDLSCTPRQSGEAIRHALVILPDKEKMFRTIALDMVSGSATRPSSFYPPQEPDWHRAIAEAAYYLAEKRGFLGEHSLDDWLAAEQQVRQVISPVFDSEVTMSESVAGPLP